MFAWLESTSLAMWVGLSNSFFAYPLILLVHTIGLTLIVGVNLIVAVRMLGMSPQIPLSELRKLFPIAWGGLAMNAVTGALLFIAKATQFIVNPAFYLKMASIAVAVVVLFVMSTKVFRDPMLDQKPLSPEMPAC